MSEPRKSVKPAHLPPFFARWNMLFRLYPNLLFNARFLFDAIINRGPIFWDNVMLAKAVREGRACQFPRRVVKQPQPGGWRIDD